MTDATADRSGAHGIPPALRPQSEARAWLAVAVLLATLGTWWLATLPNVGVDTPVVISGTNAAADCLANGPRVRCGTSPDGNASIVGPFPLLQHVPDLAFKAIGFSESQRLTGLALLSMLAFAGTVAVGSHTARALSHRPWGPAFLLALVTSPLLYYGNSTWGEMLATFALLAFTAAALLRAHPAVVAATAVAAALTKETAVLFLVPIGMIALWLAYRRSGRRVHWHAAAMAAGLALGVGLSALFNVFRYGSAVNQYYLRPEFQVSDARQQIEYFAGLLAAPSGGILLFWSTAAALLALFIVAPFVRRTAVDRHFPWLALGLAALAVALTAALTRWWQPFGWHAWGPRLSIPWMPALLLLGLAAYGAPAGNVVRAALRTPLRLAAVSAAIVLVTLPQIGFMLGHQHVLPTFFGFDERCPPTLTLASIKTEAGAEAYESCVRWRAWEKQPVLLDASRELASVKGVVFGAVWTVAIVSLLRLVRAASPLVADPDAQ